jgi:hypothetical protein
MTVTAAPPVNFDMGRVISAGFGLLARRPVPILLMALVLCYLPAVAVGWSTVYVIGPAPQLGAPPDLAATFQRLGLTELIAFFVAGVGWIFQGGVAIVATADAAGRGEEIGGRLTKALGRAPVILFAGVAATLGIFLGTLLLFVPGILLSLAWMVGPATAAVEGQGFMGIFRRSAELTRGCRGALFGIALLVGVVSITLAFALRIAVGAPLLASGGAQPALLTYVLQPALSTVIAAVTASIVASAYLELRGVKEGLTAGAFASVFD